MLEEAAVFRVRTRAVGDAEAFDLAAAQIDDVEARLADGLVKSTMPIQSRAAILCWSSAALARGEQAADRFRPARSGTTGAAGGGGSGRRKLRQGRRSTSGSTCEQPQRSRAWPPPRPAPKRIISRRLKSFNTLPVRSAVLSFNGLTADNPNRSLPGSIAVRPRSSHAWRDFATG